MTTHPPHPPPPPPPSSFFGIVPLFSSYLSPAPGSSSQTTVNNKAKVARLPPPLYLLWLWLVVECVHHFHSLLSLPLTLSGTPTPTPDKPSTNTQAPDELTITSSVQLILFPKVILPLYQGSILSSSSTPLLSWLIAVLMTIAPRPLAHVGCQCSRRCPEIPSA